MYPSRQRSQSLFEYPNDKVSSMDKSREHYFLRLEQMQSHNRMDPPTQMPLDPSNGVNDSKTKSKTKQKSVSIPIPQQGRQRRASTSVASTRGFTEDMIYLADVAGSYEVHGRLETSYSPSPEVEFIPPHKVPLHYDSTFF